MFRASRPRIVVPFELLSGSIHLWLFLVNVPNSIHNATQLFSYLLIGLIDKTKQEEKALITNFYITDFVLEDVFWAILESHDFFKSLPFFLCSECFIMLRAPKSFPQFINITDSRSREKSW
jgi:hypothetical protein